MLALTETWLYDSDVDPFTTNFAKFSFIHNSRNAMGGGVGLLFRDSLDVRRVELSNNGLLESFEYLVVKLRIGHSSDWAFVVLYRHDRGCSRDSFSDDFASLCDGLNENFGCCFTILGDFNFWVEVKDGQIPRAGTNAFKDLESSLGLQNVVEGPTHKGGHTLDLIVVPEVQADLFQRTTVLPVDEFISDHSLVLTEFVKNADLLTGGNNAMTFHSYSDFNTTCLLYTSPSPRDKRQSRMPSSA